MNQGGIRMNRGKGLILALIAAVVTACASAGGAIEGDVGNRPRDNTHTRSAGVHIAQATTSEGEAATAHYQQALDAALMAVQEEPSNPKGYLMAGQAAVGVGNWVQADTMFEKAVELYPGYADQVVAEREQAWVAAYNTGVEQVSAGNVERALELFQAAAMLYRGRPEAEMNVGWANMRLGNNEAAIEGYRNALEIIRGPAAEGLPPEQAAAWEDSERIATFNLAQLLALTGQFGEAAEVMGEYLEQNPELDTEARLSALTARAQFLAQSGQDSAATALYNELLSRPDLNAADYFQIGVGFFNTGDFMRAAEAFRRSAELNPYSRDALLNLVQSLYSEAVERAEEPESAERNERLKEIYDELVVAAEEVREFDPLNTNLLSFLLRGYRGQADYASQAEQRRIRGAIQELYTIYEDLPWEVQDVTLDLSEAGQTTISGQVLNRKGEPGTPVRLRFTLYGQNGQTIATEVITVTAAGPQEAAPFSATVRTGDAHIAGWKYELVG